MAQLLPPLRALQTFAVFGETESVARTAQTLNITPGAVSQQLKLLEEQVGRSLISRHGRGVRLRPEALAYHHMIKEAFATLTNAQTLLGRMGQNSELTLSALPSVLTKWLNPLLGQFQDHHPGLTLRLEATHSEPESDLLSASFRITFGENADRYPHKRALFQDRVFPICAPGFLEQHPEAQDPLSLTTLPLLHVDWGPQYPDLPGWAEWIAFAGCSKGTGPSAGVFSLSSLALEAAAAGKGIALAQQSFVQHDLAIGNLVRLSDRFLPLPHPYFICWGNGTLDVPHTRDFLDWVLKHCPE